MNNDELSRLKKIMREKLRGEIEQLRAERGKMSRAQIAKEIGISERYLSDVLNTDKSIGFDVIMKITDYFNVSFEWLIGREDHKRPADKIECYIKNNKRYASEHSSEQPEKIRDAVAVILLLFLLEFLLLK